ncbi:YveK family protein [Convivina intestini]|uniref:YveK family protein n=1 Tax=Convivina intestini TaxID=1505726 RepID=UPI00200E9115|nr:Wzz/FepE/Etk N-terminal domain-containing protein [Convivina intestini]CAH1850290.1 hypothetical protein R078131_00060 [Convivina intestini]
MEFSLADLAKRMVRYAWVIILCGVLAGATGYFYAKHATDMTYTAERSVVLAKSNSDVRDPNSRFLADNNLIATYKKVAQDDAVVTAAKAKLSTSFTKQEIADSIKISNPTNSLIMDFDASARTKNQAVKLVNAYTEAFAEMGQKLYPDMAQPQLLSATTSNGVKTTSFKSPKKLMAFGAVLGLVLGFVIVLVTGINANYKLAKNRVK